MTSILTMNGKVLSISGVEEFRTEKGFVVVTVGRTENWYLISQTPNAVITVIME